MNRPYDIGRELAHTDREFERRALRLALGRRA